MARFDNERADSQGSEALQKQIATLQKQLDKYRSIAVNSVGAVTKAFSTQGKAQTAVMKLQQRITKDALTANQKIAKSYEKTTKQVIKLQRQLSKQVARGASGGSGGGFSRLIAARSQFRRSSLRRYSQVSISRSGSDTGNNT